MKFFSFLSRISVVLGSIALHPYQDCALGPGQNKTETCPDTFQCTQTYQNDLIPGLRRSLRDGETFENRKTCERFSCFCSGVEEKRGIFTIRKGCELEIADNRPSCGWSARCVNVETDHCKLPILRERHNRRKPCFGWMSCTG